MSSATRGYHFDWHHPQHVGPAEVIDDDTLHPFLR
jgi:hypothetical protein